ncbi:MAG TPA: T9SS type A sorting domain-containing protein, partial [Ignavibacteria bacterium]
PNTPNLISPTNGSNILTLTPTLDWSDVTGSTSYTVQAATDTSFINLAVNQSGLIASQYPIPSGALLGNTTYYWRAKSVNEAGSGPWSVRWNFRVVTIPPVPNLVAPPNNSTNQPPTVLLDWDSLASASSYRIQIATDSLFNSMIYDTSGVTRSYLQMRPFILFANVKYFWRINAVNLAGTGPWSVVWNFRVNPTGVYQYSSDIPKEFKLYNNYPNPFNPSTTIRYQIPKEQFVILKVFDITGKEIETLVNERQSPGTYEVRWNASKYSSGVYFYKLESKYFTETKSMLLIK